MWLRSRGWLLDTHIDIKPQRFATAEQDPGVDHPDLQSDLVKMARGGVAGAFLVVFTPQRGALDESGYLEGRARVEAGFAAIERLLAMYPERCRLARTPEEVRVIAKGGHRVILIGMENGTALGEDLGLIQTWHRRGARYLGLVHGRHNQLADSATDSQAPHGGLSPLGRRAVAEMNRLGLLADASHLSEQAFWDLVRTSKAPILLSHSGCAALTPHPRNVTDDQLRAIRKNGGVIQIVAVDDFLETPTHQRAIEALLKKHGLPDRETIYEMRAEEKARLKSQLDAFKLQERELETRIPDATLKDLANHIDHAVKVTGMDHVGLGSDFGGGGGVPGFQHHGESLNLTMELLRRGYTEPQLRKLYGENLLRVWSRAEAVGREIQTRDQLRSEQLGKALGDLLQAEQARSGAPGLAVAVVSGQGTLASRTLGKASLATGAPLTDQTVFHMASVTKTAVAAALVRLSLDGRLDLDQPVVSVLPYFRLEDPRYPKLTVRQMLAHVSGLPDFDSDPWTNPSHDEGALERFVRNFVATKALSADPQTRYQYSNTAYEVLGDVIAKASGQSFEAYVQEKLLRPLGMRDSTLLLAEVDPKRRSDSHLLKEGQIMVSPVFPYNRMHAPSSTLLSTLADMARYARAHLNGGSLDGTRVLPRSALEAMWQPAYGAFENVGLAWHLGRHRELKTVFHTGSDEGFRTCILLVPEKNLGVVVLANHEKASAKALAFQALDAALGLKN